MDLHLITIPPSTTHTHTIIFLHGRGDTAHQFSASLAHSPDHQGRTLIDAFPSIRWVFPQSHIRPVASSFGDRISQWFDVWDVRDFSSREELQAEGLRESVAGVRKVVESEAALLGGHWERVVLMGISQGAATSIHTLLNLDVPPAVDENGSPRPRRLGAFLGFSCRMPFAGRDLSRTRAMLGLDNVPEDDEVLRNTPVLLEHCVDDPLVLIGHGQALRETLRGFGVDVTWRVYPDGGHWFNAPAGVDEAMTYLEKVLGLQRIGVSGGF